MRGKRRRTHERRDETNEEVMYWSKDLLGYVRLRLQFQTRSPDLYGRPRYAGLKGKSITVAVRSPGMALQLIDHIEKAIESFVPAQPAAQPEAENLHSHTTPLSSVGSTGYAGNGNRQQLPY